MSKPIQPKLSSTFKITLLIFEQLSKRNIGFCEVFEELTNIPFVIFHVQFEIGELLCTEESIKAIFVLSHTGSNTKLAIGRSKTFI